MLWWVLLAGAGLIFALVMVLLGLAFRPRPEGASGSRSEGPPGPLPERASGSGVEGAHPEQPATDGERVWLWGLGIGFPAVTLLALTAYGLVIGERLLPRAVPDLVRVSAEARQWEWTFGYDDARESTTGGVLHIPAGRPVDVSITSLDVVHSFWVPRLAGKLDAIPGHVNVLRIEAATPGEYAGVSAEFSGAGYREHVFTVVAHDPASWNAFLAGALP